MTTATNLAVFYGRLLLAILIASLSIFHRNHLATAYAIWEGAQSLWSLWNYSTTRMRDRSATGLAVPLLYLLSGVFIPSATPHHDSSTVVILSLALAVIVWAALSLRDNYTVGSPIWNKLTDHGPYALVRHPQATAGIFVRLALTSANPSSINAATLLLYVLTMTLACEAEERFLRGFPTWQDYALRVPYKYFPGFFE